MSLAFLLPEATAAIRQRYSRPPRPPKARVFRGARKWTDAEDTHLYQHAATSTVKELCEALNRREHSMRSRLKALGLKPVMERQR